MPLYGENSLAVRQDLALDVRRNSKSMIITLWIIISYFNKTGKPWHWTRKKIEDDLKTITTDLTKKCVHEYNLQWHNNYERAMENTASVKA